MTLKRIVAAALLAGGGVLGTAGPAAAVCDPVIYELTGKCENECTIAGKAVRVVTDAAGDPLPEWLQISCSA